MNHSWLVWQIADSSFPTGGFAHSGGLEAAVQLGVVRDGETLLAFLHSAIQQLDAGVGQIMRLGWRKPTCLSELDQECDLFLNNHVANRASRCQGQAFLASAAKTFAVDSLGEQSRNIRDTNRPGHLAPVFATVLRELDIGEDEMIELFRFISVRAFLSSAVRLGIVGPMQAQKIQAQLGRCDFASTSPDCDALATGPPRQISPILDLLQATHDRLYSRLFQS